jgi:hypothetical protein
VIGVLLFYFAACQQLAQPPFSSRDIASLRQWQFIQLIKLFTENLLFGLVMAHHF